MYIYKIIKDALIIKYPVIVNPVENKFIKTDTFKKNIGLGGIPDKVIISTIVDNDIALTCSDEDWLTATNRFIIIIVDILITL